LISSKKITDIFGVWILDKDLDCGKGFCHEDIYIQNIAGIYKGRDNLQDAYKKIINTFTFSRVEFLEVVKQGEKGYLEWSGSLNLEQKWNEFDKSLGRTVEAKGIILVEFSESGLLKKWYAQNTLLTEMARLNARH